jgi:hypothetical protein
MVKRDARKDDRAIQRTNEVFEGEGSLYDSVLCVGQAVRASDLRPADRQSLLLTGL